MVPDCRAACECPAAGKGRAALGCGQSPSAGTAALPRGQGEGSSTFQEPRASARLNSQLVTRNRRAGASSHRHLSCISMERPWVEQFLPHSELTELREHGHPSQSRSCSSHTQVNSSTCQQSLKTRPQPSDATLGI